MQQAEIREDQVRQLGRLWWLPVGLGVLSIIVGAIVLAKPDNSLRAFAVIVGIFVLLDGIVELVSAFGGETTNRGLAVLLGLLNLIVGILLIRHPIAGVQAVALFLGIWLIAAGAVRVAMASARAGNRLTWLLIAALEVVFGLVIVASPHIGFTTLALIVGIGFIANGIAVLGLGLLLRTVKHDARSRRRVRERPRPVRTSR